MGGWYGQVSDEGETSLPYTLSDPRRNLFFGYSKDSKAYATGPFNWDFSIKKFPRTALSSEVGSVTPRYLREHIKLSVLHLASYRPIQLSE
ncbi:unnamed protein product, partial [Brenthis ino]